MCATKFMPHIGHRFLRLFAYASIIGVLGVVIHFTPMGQSLEENTALAWLFELRGAVKAPEDVVIIGLDKTSAEMLSLPENPAKWSRTYYAELLKKINLQAPSLVAFNVYFGEARDQPSDQQLAAQVAGRKNVILTSLLKHSSSRASNILIQSIGTERVINPIPILSEAALDSAPFPVPKTDSTIKTFWSYRHKAGDVATFPVSIAQHFILKAVYPELLALLSKMEPPFVGALSVDAKMAEIQEIQNYLRANPQVLKRFSQALAASNFPPKKMRLLRAWLNMLALPESVYLNYYGNTGTITTIPFYKVLMQKEASPGELANKVVLIGYSETIEPEMNQGFYTVYSQAEGQTVSNIELAATAVGNLLEHSWLQPLSKSWSVILLISWGFLLVWIARVVSYRWSMIIIVALGLGYSLVAYFSFATAHIWLPLATPLLIQLPLVLVLASVMQYSKDKLQQANIQNAFSFYLPKSVVSDLSTRSGLNAFSEFGRLTEGVCLATDAGQYTALSEILDPTTLHQLMNSYYAVIFAEIKKYHGVVSDVVGDAVVALWANSDDEFSRVNACNAILAIETALLAFNEAQSHQLPTRMALHYGEMRLGNVGAGDHFEYRAVGDTINTAARVENLNKLLGTRTLVTSSVLEDLPGFCSREIGTFILKGKSQPIQVFELMGQGQLAEEVLALQRLFTNALALFQNYRWVEALEAFRQLVITYPVDGPSRFYYRYLLKNIAFFETQVPNKRMLWIDSDFASSTLLRF